MQQGRYTPLEAAELEELSAPWELLVDSPDNGEPCAELNFLSAPGLTIFHEAYRRPTRLLGMPPPNALILGIPIGVGRGSTAYGREIVSNQIYCLAGSALEACYQHGQEVLEIHLDLTQRFDDTLGLAVERLVSGAGTFTVVQQSPETHRLVDRLCRIFARSEQRGALTSEQPASEEPTSIMNAIRDALLPYRLDEIKGKTSSQTHAVAVALEYLRVYSECTSVSALCAGAGISQRTLERGVRSLFDCTAVQLLRKWRLHKARRELASATPLDTTVSQIAASLGFHDFGRFASYYLTTFGEYPSATLSAAPSVSGRT